MKKISLLLLSIFNTTCLWSAESPRMLTGAQPNVAQAVLPANGAELEEFLSSPSVSGSSDGSEKENSKSIHSDRDSEISGDGYETAHSEMDEGQSYFGRLTSAVVSSLPSLTFRRGNTQSLPTHPDKERPRDADLGGPAIEESEELPGPARSELIIPPASAFSPPVVELEPVTYKEGTYEYSLQETGMFNKDSKSRELLPAPKTIMDILRTDKQVAREPRISGFTIGAMATTPLVLLGASLLVLDRVGSSVKVSVGTLGVLGTTCALGEYMIYSNAGSTVYQKIKTSLSEIPVHQLDLIARYNKYLQKHGGANPFLNYEGKLSYPQVDLMKRFFSKQKVGRIGICINRDRPYIIETLDDIQDRFEHAHSLCRDRKFTVHLEGTDDTTTLQELLDNEISQVKILKDLVEKLFHKTTKEGEQAESFVAGPCEEAGSH